MRINTDSYLYDAWIDDQLDMDLNNNTKERGICPDCEGSGEGNYDGSTCKTCRGLGEI
jgi:DnaJ-class molecular chaperone